MKGRRFLSFFLALNIALTSMPVSGLTAYASEGGVQGTDLSGSEADIAVGSGNGGTYEESEDAHEWFIDHEYDGETAREAGLSGTDVPGEDHGDTEEDLVIFDEDAVEEASAFLGDGGDEDPERVAGSGTVEDSEGLIQDENGSEHPYFLTWTGLSEDTNLSLHVLDEEKEEDRAALEEIRREAGVSQIDDAFRIERKAGKVLDPEKVIISLHGYEIQEEKTALYLRKEAEVSTADLTAEQAEEIESDAKVRELTYTYDRTERTVLFAAGDFSAFTVAFVQKPEVEEVLDRENTEKEDDKEEIIRGESTERDITGEDTAAEEETEPQPGTVAEAGADAEAETEPQTEAGADAEAETEPQTEAVSEAETETVSGSEDFPAPARRAPLRMEASSFGETGEEASRSLADSDFDDHDISIDSFSASLVSGAVRNAQGDLVWTAENLASGHAFIFRITYGLSGTYHYDPYNEETGAGISIRIPRSILLNREGKSSDTYEMSILRYDEVEEDDTSEIFVYKEDPKTNEIVIYNRLESKAGRSGIIDVSYLTSELTSAYADYGMLQQTVEGVTLPANLRAASNPFSASIRVKMENVEKTAKTEEIPVYINTTAKVNKVTKRTPTYFDEWSPALGNVGVIEQLFSAASLPEGVSKKPEDYVYLLWPVIVSYTANQPFMLSLTESFTPDQGYVLGYRHSMSGEISSEKEALITPAVGAVQDCFWSVLTCLNKEYYNTILNQSLRYSVSNRVTAEVKPADEVDAVTRASSSAGYTREKKVLRTPTGAFYMWKWGQTTRGGWVWDSEDISSYQLTDFKESYDQASEDGSSLKNLRYYTYVHGYPFPWTLPDGATSEDWDQYGTVPVTYTLEDRTFHLKDITDTEYSADSLTYEDYQIDSIRLQYFAYDRAADVDKQEFIDTGIVYAEDESAWIDIYAEKEGKGFTSGPVARLNLNLLKPKWEILDPTYVKSIEDNGIKVCPESSCSSSIYFQENITGYKLQTSNAFYYTQLGAYPSVSLKPSERVKQLTDKALSEGEGKIALRNSATSSVTQVREGQAEKTLVRFAKQATDYIAGNRRWSQISKEVVHSWNSVRDRLYYVTWSASAEEKTFDEYGRRVNISQNGGTFYDLLPKDAEYQQGSVRLYADGFLLPEDSYTVETESDHEGSGRVLLTVRTIGGETFGQLRMIYTTVQAWDEVLDHKTQQNKKQMLYNSVAYETGNDTIAVRDGYQEGDAEARGEVSPGYDKKKETEYLSPDILDPDADGKKFLYANAEHQISAPMAASLDLYKMVKAYGDDGYSYATTTYSDAPYSSYSYRIRFATDASTKARDLILYDSLENYQVTAGAYQGSKSDWHGILEGIDTSQIKNLGIVPVLYYSTVENLNIEKNFHLDNSGNEVSGDVWIEESKYLQEGGQLSQVKAFAIDLCWCRDGDKLVPFTLEAGKAVSCTVRMRAPEATEKDRFESSDGDRRMAYNNIYLQSLEMDKDASDASSAPTLKHQDFTRLEYRVAGDFSICKVDSSDTSVKLKGFVFRLRGTSVYGTEVDLTRETNGEGRISFRKIERGTYELTEVSGNDDYFLDGMTRTVTVDESGRVTIQIAGEQTSEEGTGEAALSSPFEIRNDPRIHGDLEFKKYGMVYETDGTERKEALREVTFCLSGTSDYGNEILMYASSQRDGTVKLSNIEMGTYDLTEVQTAEGYLLPHIPWRVVCDENGVLSVYESEQTEENVTDEESWKRIGQEIETGDMILTNEPSHSIRFMKNESLYSWIGLSEAAFFLTGTSDYGTSVQAETVSDEYGIVRFDGLEPGKYVLKETSAPPRHALDETDYLVTVRKDGSYEIEGMLLEEEGDLKGLYQCPNDRIYEGTITIKKKWEDGSPSSDEIPVIHLDTTEPKLSHPNAIIDRKKWFDLRTYLLVYSDSYFQEDLKDFGYSIEDFINDPEGIFVDVMCWEYDLYDQWMKGVTSIVRDQEKDKSWVEENAIRLDDERVPGSSIYYWLEDNETETEITDLSEILPDKKYGDSSGFTLKLWSNAEKIGLPADSSRFFSGGSMSAIDFSAFDTSRVTNMSEMFKFCTHLTSLDVSTWDTSQVTNMSEMFSDCVSLTSLDVSTWDTGQVTDMSGMFMSNDYKMKLADLDLSTWNTSRVTNMSEMFWRCVSLTSLDLSTWDTSQVTNMSRMFNDCLALTSLDVSTWDTSQVTNMSSLFSQCGRLASLDLSNWNTSRVTNMSSMVWRCRNLETIYVGAGWDVSSADGDGSMFIGCDKLIGGQGTKYDATKTNKEYARVDNPPDAPGYLTFKSPTVQTASLAAEPAGVLTRSEETREGSGGGSEEDADGSDDEEGDQPEQEVPSIVSQTSVSVIWDKKLYPDQDSSEVYDQWVQEEDGSWTYRFHVYDETADYYIWEEYLSGWTSAVMDQSSGAKAEKYTYEEGKRKPNEVTVTNTKKEDPEKPDNPPVTPPDPATGNLMVRKALVSDNAADANKKFDLKITLSFPETSLPDALESVTYGGVTFSSVESNQGKKYEAIVSLKAGDSVMLAGLPTGIGYTVTEQLSEGAAYTVSYSGEVSDGDDLKSINNLAADGNDTGSGDAASANSFAAGIVAGRTSAVTVTNTSTKKTGTLILSKQVVSGSEDPRASVSEEDRSKKFTFHITLSGASTDRTIADASDQSTGVNGIYSGYIFTGGKATVYLSEADGELKISGLPSGLTYSVTEEREDGYELVYAGMTNEADKSVLRDGLGTQTASTVTGTIPSASEEDGTAAEASVRVGFCNQKLPEESQKAGGFTLKKDVIGGLEGDSFDFHISFTGLTKNQIYTLQVNQPAAGQEEGQSGDTVSFTSSSYGTAFVPFTMTKGASVSISDLPEHAAYQITEDGGNYTASYIVAGDASGFSGASEGQINSSYGEAVQGHSLSTARETVEEREHVFITFTNEGPKYPVTFWKMGVYQSFNGNELDEETEESPEPLAGARLQIIEADSSGSGAEIVRAQWDSSDRSGKELLLPPGVYTLREAASPAGYAAAEDIIFRIGTGGEVSTLQPDGSWESVISSTVTMEDPQTRVVIEKRDASTHNALDLSDRENGAKLEIREGSETGQVICSWTTGGGKNDQKEITGGLEVEKTYYLVEKEAPQGYEKATAIAFTMDAFGQVYVGGEKVKDNLILMDDRRSERDRSVYENLKITKRAAAQGDVQGALLSGAVFSLYESLDDAEKEENQLAAYTTGADGTLIISAEDPWLANNANGSNRLPLPGGSKSFYLRETQAPIGYLFPEEKSVIEIEISAVKSESKSWDESHSFYGYVTTYTVKKKDVSEKSSAREAVVFNTPKTGKTTITVKKILDGGVSGATLKSHPVSFQLWEADAYEEYQRYLAKRSENPDAVTDPAPSPLRTAFVNSGSTEQTVSFDQLYFGPEDFKGQGNSVTKNYIICEELPSDASAKNKYTIDGVTYDTEVHSLQLTLTMTDTGITVTKSKAVFDTETGTVTYTVDDSHVPEFTNIYQAEGEGSIAIQKTLTGRPVADSSFSFEAEAYLPENPTEADISAYQLAVASLHPGQVFSEEDYADKSKTNVNTALVPDRADTDTVSGSVPLTFTQPGIYRYVVREVIPDDAQLIKDGSVLMVTGESGESSPLKYKDATEEQKTGTVIRFGGVTYDTHAAILTVTVRDDGKGHLLTEARDEDGQPISLYSYDNSAAPTPSDQQVSAAAAFTNTYAADPAAVQVRVDKTLSGRSWKNGDSFSFTIAADTERQSENPGSKTAPIKGESKISITNEDENAVTAGTKYQLFDALEFTLDDLKQTGTGPEGNGVTAGRRFDDFYYIVTEKLPEDLEDEQNATGRWKKNGIIYDTVKRKVHVRVTDNGDGTMSAVTYVASNDSAADNVEEASTNTVSFTNKYQAAQTSARVAVRKQLDGRAWKEGDSYEFTIAHDENHKEAPMPANTTVTITKDSSSVGEDVKEASSGEITFTQADLKGETEKTFSYLISEIIPDDAFILVSGANDQQEKVLYKEANPEQKASGGFSKDGVIYATAPHSVHITLKDNGDGTLSTTTKYDDDKDVPAVFVNEYIAKPTHFTLKANKLVNGVLTGGYSFALYDNNGDDAQGSLIGTSAVGSDGRLSAEVSELEFDKPGKYKYQLGEMIPVDAVLTDESGNVIKNNDGSDITYSTASDEQKATGRFVKAGVTYDSKTVDVTVTVTDNTEGQLVADVSYGNNAGPQDRKNQEKYSDLNNTSESGATFENTYDATGTAVLRAIKHISGRDWLDGDSFSFELTPVAGAPLRTGTDGASVGSLSGTARKETVDEHGDHPVSFGTIYFKLSDLDGEASKTFEYKVSETGLMPGGMQRAGDRIIRVKVTDAGDGTLNVQYAPYDAKTGEILPDEWENTIDAPDLTNIYTTRPVTAKIQASKMILDDQGKESDTWIISETPDTSDPTSTVEHNWSEETFTFRLERTRKTTPMPDGKDTDYVDRTVEVSNKTAIFDNITFTEPGEYDYTIRELRFGDSTDGDIVHELLLYDTSVHSARVIVTDNGDGTLSEKVHYYRGDVIEDAGGEEETGEGNGEENTGGENAAAVIPVFYNRETPDAYALIQTKKELTGTALRGGEFSFALYESNESGVLIKPFKKNQNEWNASETADGIVNFRAIPFSYNDIDHSTAYDPENPHKLVKYFLIREMAPEGAEVREDGTWSYQGMENVTGDVLVRVTVTETNPVKKTLKTTVEYKVEDNWVESLPTIKNEYTAQGAASLDASKHIEGRAWKEGESFTFELTGEANAPIHVQENDDIVDRDKLTATATEETRIADFAELIFTQADLDGAGAKEYTYRIHEVNPLGGESEEADGITENDNRTWTYQGITSAPDATVTIRLEDDGKGNIRVTYKGRDQDGKETWLNTPINPQFNNHYVITDSKAAKIQVYKQLSGRDWEEGDSFTFRLVPVSNTADYAVNEMPMPVGSDSAGVSTVTIDTAAVDNASLDVTGAARTKSGTFGEISFTIPGTYVYEIEEIIPEDAQNAAGTTYAQADADAKAAGGWKKNGVTYVQAKHKVTVKVEDNGDGKLKSPTITYTATGTSVPATFANTYEPAQTSLALRGHKTMLGRELITGNYSFDLYEAERVEGDGEDAAQIRIKTNAAGESVPVFNGAVDEAGTMTSHTLTFTRAGTYYYIIREHLPDGVSHSGTNVTTKDGITYSTHECKVTVTVTDVEGGKHTGQLRADISYDNSDAAYEEDRNQSVQAAFTNAYKAHGTAVLQAQKHLTGRAWLPDENFSFSVKAEDGAPMYKASAASEADTETKKTAFTEAERRITVSAERASANLPSALYFDQEDLKGTDGKYVTSKDFWYKITEIIPDDAQNEDGGSYRDADADARVPGKWKRNGITYDTDACYACVTVSDNARNGTLTTSVAYYNEKDKNSTRLTVPEFVNVYQAETDVPIAVRKTMTGADWSGFTEKVEGETVSIFRFDLKQGQTTLQEGARVSLTPGATYGQAVFTPLHYTQEDLGTNGEAVFTYVITEAEPEGTEAHKKDGVVYDTSAHSIEVHLKDNGDGTITATKYKVVGDTRTQTEELPVFTNHYQVNTPATAELSVTKKLSGRPIAGGEFTFTLREVTENSSVSRMLRKAVVSPDGKNPYSASGSFQHLTYDGESLKEADGTYSAQKTFVYEIAEIIPDDAQDEDGVSYQDAKADARVSGKWKKNGITYDTNAYYAKVTLTNNFDGTLSTDVTYFKDKGLTQSAEGAEFANAYTAEGTLALRVQKHVEGREWLENETFGFLLTPKDGAPMPESEDSTAESPKYKNSLTVTTTAEGREATFDEIPFDLTTLKGKLTPNEQGILTGSFSYTLKEILPDGVTEEKPTKQGLTYDTGEHEITVTVQDNRAGELQVTALAYDSQNAPTLNITNPYHAQGTAVLMAAKRLTGGENLWKKNGLIHNYTFHVSALNTPGVVTPLPEADKRSVSVTASDYPKDQSGESITASDLREGFFGPITYTAAGIYHYLITEEIPANAHNAEGINYAAATPEQKTAGGFVSGDIEYDASVWEAVVTVTDPEQNGELHTEVVYRLYDPGADAPDSSAGESQSVFSNRYLRTKVRVTKKWEDEEDKAKLRPASVTAVLSAKYEDGSEVDLDALVKALKERNGTETAIRTEKILNAQNDWTDLWDHLPAKYNGKEILYSVTEKEVPLGYTFGARETENTEGSHTYEITNKISLTDLEVTKDWKDEENQDGIRPGKITLRLSAKDQEGKAVSLPSGIPTSATVSADASGDWKYLWRDLPRLVNGEAITYEVTEDPVKDYVTTVTRKETDPGEKLQYTVTNTHTPEEISVSALKVWMDGDNRDGLRYDLKLTLYEQRTETVEGETQTTERPVAGAAVYEISREASGDDLKVTWSKLPKYRDRGTPIRYLVRETAAEGSASPGYTASYTGDYEKGITITNTYDPERVQVRVTKHWEDADDQDGIRPEEIYLRLSGTKEDGTPAMIGAGGSLYRYARLKDPDARDLSAGASETPDAEGGEGSDPEEEEIRERTNIWSHTWSNLYRFEDGQEITYQVDEVLRSNQEGTGITYSVGAPDGYEIEKGESNSTELSGGGRMTRSDTYAITNRHKPEVFDLPVEKVWKDEDDWDGLRPASVTVRLFADGEEIDHAELSKGDDWAHLFTGLERNRNGKAIDYTVTEDPVEDYTAAITSATLRVDGVEASGYRITNTHAIETTRLRVVKQWVDVFDEDGLRSSVGAKIQLYRTADGVKSAVGDPVSVGVTENWSYLWYDLPVTKNGKSVSYSVEETMSGASAGAYTSSVSAPVQASGEDSGTITVTNTHPVDPTGDRTPETTKTPSVQTETSAVSTEKPTEKSTEPPTDPPSETETDEEETVRSTNRSGEGPGRPTADSPAVSASSERAPARTGDETPLLTWALVLTAAATAMGAAGILRIRRKRRKHRP